jgi:hypothetical protein
LFRKTPGYSEDILIDTHGPGYTERRHLADRVAERANVPVVKPAPPDYGLSAIEVNKPIIEYPPPREPSVLRKERPMPPAAMSEVHSSSSSRRRRTPKRRIVDLSTSDASPNRLKPAVRFSTDEAPSAQAIGSDSGYGVSPDPSPRTVPSYVPSESRALQSQPEIPRVNSSAVPRLAPIEGLSYEPPLIKEPSSSEPQDWGASGNIYRQKIEALRSEV